MWTILAVLAGLEFLGSVLPRSLSWWILRRRRRLEEARLRDEIQVLAVRLGITSSGVQPLADDIVTAVEELRGELAMTQELLRETC